MSKQQLVRWTMSLVALSFAARERKQTEYAREFFAQRFPEDAAALVIEAQCEAVEVAS